MIPWAGTPQWVEIKTWLRVERGRLWGRVFGLTTRNFSAALVDQALVSAVNLMTTIMIGRFCGPEELANYALGFTLLLLIISVMDTLIAMPYTVLVHRLEGAARLEYRGAVLLQCGLLSALVVLVLAIGGLVFSFYSDPAGLGPLLFVLSVAIPFCLLREYARRLFFAHLNSNQALQLDLAVGALQIFALVILTTGGLLTAVKAIMAMGAANALVGLSWLIHSRSEWQIRSNQIWPALRRNLAFGRWIFAGRIVGQLNSDILLLWLMAFALGKKATGIFAACMTVIHLSNPFILGVGQMLTPYMAQAMVDGGPGKVRRVTLNATVLIGLVLCGFCLCAWFLGEVALRIFYGSQYVGHGSLITLLSVSVLAFALSMPVMSSLLVMERPDMSLKANLVGLLLTTTFSFLLVWSLGLVGVAWGLIAGQTGSSVIRWIVFNHLSRNTTHQEDRNAI